MTAAPGSSRADASSRIAESSDSSGCPARPRPACLRNWTIPRTRHELSRHDTALYALSVGMGADPLDPRISPFVDPWAADPLFHPAMALVLGYPGFWLGQPEVAERTGVEIGHILHIEQAVELIGDLPTQGVVCGETRVTGLVDRGAGRGALLTSERIITEESSGERIAVCRQSHLLRGVTVEGERAPAGGRQPPPPRPADHCIQVPTRADQALLYRLNGDSNPLHSDPSVAAAAGFERPILHGMCTIGLAITGLLGSLADYDPRRVAGFSVRMSAPVFPGDTIAIDAWADGVFRARAQERDVTVLDAGKLFLRQR